MNKEKYTGSMNSFLKPKFFNTFHENTLFYIFYYLTRDTQLFAGEIYIKWDESIIINIKYGIKKKKEVKNGNFLIL